MYDIKMDEEGAKIRKRVFELCKKYLHHIQFSVFEGQVDKSEVFLLEQTIREMTREEDSVIIFKSIFDKPPQKTIIGSGENKTDNFI